MSQQGTSSAANTRAAIQALETNQGHSVSQPAGHRERLYYQWDLGCDLHGGTFLEPYSVVAHNTVEPSVLISFVLHGELEVSYDGIPFHLKSEPSAQGLMVNLTKPASFQRVLKKHRHTCKLNIMLPRAWLLNRYCPSVSNNAFFERHLSAITFEVNQDLEHAINRLLAQPSPVHFTDKLDLECSIYQLLRAVFSQVDIEQAQNAAPCHAHRPQQNDQEPHPITRPFHVTLSRLLSHIEQHLDGPFTVEQLANVAAMSRSNLQRQFKAAMGYSLLSYIKHRRLELAHQQLSQGLVSVTQAAYNAGYRHPSNFTHAFHKAFGYPPKSCLSPKDSSD
ncbi:MULTISPECIES: AraC family transcriptional regulator [unclassified Vibrio]|uniref:Helix-turn-helix domain-containing protein n=1 Tax=Vibrio sp. HB236076 TaxID=3232307 RepID=A0AB39HGC2_9VIBR|nr:AraC family transcriptional regulator [Vibrio sp. HB161653]MDP5255181.1 AraC family transcriptional regulator [Vibrio sp. HB161653]